MAFMNQPRAKSDGLVPLDAFGILPLSSPVGFNAAMTSDQPVVLHIKPGNAMRCAEITDDYGRELVRWERQSFSLSNRRVFTGPDGTQLYTLRSRPSSMATRFVFARSARPWYLETPDGTHIAYFDASGIGFGVREDWAIQFLSKAGKGEEVKLVTRGKRMSDLSMAVMLQGTPVIRINRSRDLMVEGFGFTHSLDEKMQAVVAPGFDIQWAATIMSCLEIVWSD